MRLNKLDEWKRYVDELITIVKTVDEMHDIGLTFNEYVLKCYDNNYR